MDSTRYVHKVSKAALCGLLKVDDRGLRELGRRGGLPAPIDGDDEDTWWSIPEIRGWLAATNYRPWGSWWWPGGRTRQRRLNCLGAQVVRRDSAADEPAAVLQRWQTDTGVVVVAWPPGSGLVDGEGMARWVPGADAYLVVGLGWRIYGPTVWAYPGSQPADKNFDLNWHDLARVLGRPAPYWPDRRSFSRGNQEIHSCTTSASWTLTSSR